MKPLEYTSKEEREGKRERERQLLLDRMNTIRMRLHLSNYSHRNTTTNNNVLYRSTCTILLFLMDTLYSVNRQHLVYQLHSLLYKITST